MKSKRTCRRGALGGMILSLLLAAMLLPGLASAGCGCDHPPPEWAPVMPYFAPTGSLIRIWSDRRAFSVGDTYEVKIDGKRVSGGRVVAEAKDHLDVAVPASVKIGPARVEVTRRERQWWGGWADTIYVSWDASVFTVIPGFLRVPPEDGVFESKAFEVAVDTEGVVLLPLDLTDFEDASQFAFQYEGVGMAFSADDVTFYSKDGVDLTLFTLTVDDATEREWGSYHGWLVDEDNALSGYRFNDRSAQARDMAGSSDILSYWRHEFHTYAEAHLPGGSHEVGDDGFHPDGTLHVEHRKVVLAIRGMRRDPLFPDNEYAQQPFEPGSLEVRLNVAIRASEEPIEPVVMVPLVEDSVAELLEVAVEHVAAAESFILAEKDIDPPNHHDSGDSRWSRDRSFSFRWWW